MRLFTPGMLAAAAMVATFGLGADRAEAAPISWDIAYNPTDVLMDNVGTACTGNVLANTASASACQSLQFVYVLDGFNAGTDALASGSLTLFFYDDSDPGPGAGGSHSESVNVSLDGVLSGGAITITNGASSGSPFSPPAFNVLAQLADGQLSVLLALPTEGAGNNDFYFASATLIARGERTELEEEDPPPTGGVPEPASLLLFGMAGLAARRVARRGN